MGMQPIGIDLGQPGSQRRQMLQHGQVAAAMVGLAVHRKAPRSRQQRVEAGQKTLKEAVNEAMRDWVTNVRDTHYILGTAYGAHPYPMMVRDFHRIISMESKQQMLRAENKLPDHVVACVGGGSNAIGSFFEYLDEHEVELIGVDVEEATFDDGRTFVERNGITWPNLYDPDGRSRKYFGLGVPVTWFIAADGSVAGKKIGVIKSEAELITLTEKYLGVRV